MCGGLQWCEPLPKLSSKKAAVRLLEDAGLAGPAYVALAVEQPLHPALCVTLSLKRS